MRVEAPSLDQVRQARGRLADSVVRTPLIAATFVEPPASVHLKLENLQPIGSFKLRGAGNAMLSAEGEDLRRGVWTVSAGNMAQGVAWNARRLGIPCTVAVPDQAPATKCEAVERLGGRIVRFPFDEWWSILLREKVPDIEGVFVHPVSDTAVMAGNGTIGLEILEDLPDVEHVLVPYGGGGLSCGIAAALRQAGSRARVWACEVDAAAPLAASLRAGCATRIEYRRTFVDGIGGSSVLREMWPLVQDLLAGSITVSVEEVAQAVRLLAIRHRVIAEGAGAASVAAALSSKAPSGRRVCVVSGGNIDPDKLSCILSGQVPS